MKKQEIEKVKQTDREIYKKKPKHLHDALLAVV